MALTAAQLQQDALNVAVALQSRIRNGTVVPHEALHELACAVQMLAQAGLGGSFLPASASLDAGYTTVTAGNVQSLATKGH